jgi:hypothetical protein
MSVAADLVTTPLRREMTYACSGEHCDWIGTRPDMTDMGASLGDEANDGRPMPGRRYAAVCPRCRRPARRIVMPAPQAEIPLATLVVATAGLVGALELALGVLDIEQKAGRLAMGVQPQIDELRSLHLQLKMLSAQRAKAAA